MDCMLAAEVEEVDWEDVDSDWFDDTGSDDQWAQLSVQYESALRQRARGARTADAVGAEVAGAICELMDTVSYMRPSQDTLPSLAMFLRTACWWGGPAHAEVVEHALAHGADPTLCETAAGEGSTEGLCALHIAAHRASLPLLRTLLDAMASAGHLHRVNVESKPGSASGCSCCHCCPTRSVVTPLAALLKSEAQWWDRFGGETAGARVASGRDPEGCLRLLLTVPHLDLHCPVDPDGGGYPDGETGRGLPLAVHALQYWPCPLTDLVAEEVRGLLWWTAPRAAWAGAVVRGGWHKPVA